MNENSLLSQEVTFSIIFDSYPKPVPGIYGYREIQLAYVGLDPMHALTCIRKRASALTSSAVISYVSVRMHAVEISVVLAPNFEVASCVVTDRASLRCILALMDVTAVSAFPLDRGIFLKDLPLLYVC